jgi:hypothetical protein
MGNIKREKTDKGGIRITKVYDPELSSEGVSEVGFD